MSIRRMGTRVALVAVGVLVSVVFMAAPSWAAKPGNSENAKLCQKGKWKELVDGKGNAFKSEEECVAYGAKGGTPQPGTANLTLSPSTSQGNPSSTGTKNYFYDFGLVASATRMFTVTNEGTGTSNALHVIGGGPRFALSNDKCTGNALAPSGTCTFEIGATAPAVCNSGDPYGPEAVDVGFQDNGSPYIHLNVGAECP